MEMQTPKALFRRTNETTLAEERQWWQSRMDHRQTAFITTANSAAFPFIQNMICSLLNTAPELLDRLVIWALDEGMAMRLLEFREKIISKQFLDMTGRSFPNQKRFAWKHPLGIYFDEKETSTPTFTSGFVDTENYYDMVGMRRGFFVHVLDSIGINFLFTDADVYFASDPFADLNLPFGVSDDEKRTGRGKASPNTLEDFEMDFPDIIYSTDARKPFRYLVDPYEGQSRVPKVCGGFFFARSNMRTVKLYKAIRDNNLNDQWGVDNLLNNHIPSVLVDPLPAGIRKRKQDLTIDLSSMEGGWTWRDPIRVRILSQAAYSNALPNWASPGSRGPTFDELLEELWDRGEKDVMYHPNYWIDVTKPADRPWVFTDNKTWILEKAG
ncbi:hypothetical protein HDU67_009344, partial [Dinochytrium kinnereticum]